MAQEASWPTRPTLTSFGDELIERIRPLLPHEVGADLINLIRWTLAGSARVGPKAMMYVDDDGTALHEENAWHGAACTSARTGAGVYTISSPGSVTDNRGQSVAVTFTCASVSVQSASPRFVVWDFVDADELIVRVFDDAGFAVDEPFTVCMW